ncbi:hypothetical protein DENSPDRAFT_893964 [Dentipellis sp. KUC8613]|nr:hypothetical protein DENSPDRAFT_893964 [Dentipellis sp. KUC8613]
MASQSADGAKRGPARITEKVSDRAALQQTYASDPKYKKYTQQVEKCLSSFDNVHEWADFIAFLKNLLKTLQAYMQFKEIPRKITVSKRLSQCLNPALPSGVHQRALDVYTHILAVVGSEGLKRDLALWASGLFPFFEYAATSVKPTLLNLYETYFLPLQGGLRPVMKGFILALLPGLEEETGEFFEKVLGLLDRLSGTVSPSFFLQNIWLVMLTTPSARGTAINFLSRRLPRLNADEDITHIVGRDTGLMIRAFAAALEDDNLLVRRGALDLLLQSLRIDGTAVAKASEEDRAILMRAATSVVMRRDLSLNRRLYTWLLGPDENAQQQVAYLKKNALELLRTTLRDDMFSPSSEYSESRPFKIFISLLDKWEVGSSLTEVLALDAFTALKTSVEENAETSDEMSMTASTLYEAVEPQLFWKQLLKAIISDIVGDGTQCESIRLAQFILTKFHVRDEEIETVHLPIVFSAAMEVIKHQVAEDSSKATRPAMLEALRLQENILAHIAPAALAQIVNAAVVQDPPPTGPYAYATSFYGLELSTILSSERTGPGVPMVTAFENLIAVSATLSRRLSATPDTVVPLRQIFVQSLSLLNKLISVLDEMDEVHLTASWDPPQWLSDILATLEHDSATFVMIDQVVTFVVAMQQVDGLEPKITVQDRATLFKLIQTIFNYLRPSHSVYHVRAVNLIWALDSACKRRHVESIISQSLNAPESRNAQGSYEAFGIFWRLSDDAMLPGFRFRVPMMIVLDTLKSDDPSLRRIGETWMRCSLKSYLRVLDPILYDLLDPSLHRTPSTTKLNGKELQDYSYERPFDQSYIRYLLETLLSVVRFGGQGFAKSARTNFIRKSQHAGLIERVEASGVAHPEASYQDVLVEVTTRLLLSECKHRRVETMAPVNVVIQSATIDLLQAIVSRGEVDLMALESIEAAVIGKLYFSVHSKRLDLQNKLLHLLHSVISATTALQDVRLQRTPKAIPMDGPERPGSRTEAQETGPAYSVNPLLIQTLIDGIAIPSNHGVLQHWLDFVLMTIPQFQQTLHIVLSPLCDCVGKQLRLCLADIRRASSATDRSDEDLESVTTDSDFIMLLNALERLVLLSLSSSDIGAVEEDGTPAEKPTTPETGGLFGIMTNVFSSDATQNALDEQLTSRSPSYRTLHEAVRVLFNIWTTMTWSESQAWTPSHESLSMIFSKARVRCRRVFEHFFRVQSSEVLESIIDCWNKENTPLTAFELVDALTSSAQNVVHMVCESISSRMLGFPDKSRRHAINPNVSDAVLFNFLEQYLQQLEGPLALQVWGRFLQLAKEVVSTAKDYKAQVFPVLRCMSVLADKLTQTTAMEDRRVRKELQDTYGKLLDAAVLQSSRNADQNSWIRRSARESLVPNGRDSPLQRSKNCVLSPSDLKLDEKMNASSASLNDSTPAKTSDLAEHISQFIAKSVLPNLRKYLMDNDKVNTACANIVYYIVNPSTKSKSRPLDLDPVVLDILREMSHISAAIKSWRNPVLDILNDNRFFNGAPQGGSDFQPIARSLIDTDKSAFSELLSKVYTAASANIFTNREYENLLRSLNLRRMSYLLYCGEKNQFLTSLPTIQEKLVEVLRNAPAPIVQAEVYLCVRVLLCRLSPHNLVSFWPVILNEMYRLFDSMTTTLPSDGSEDLPLVLAACKLLDLLLVLQTEEFQVHQWIFVTDTVDAIYRPDEWLPEALLDQLAEVAGRLPVSETISSTSTGLPFPLSAITPSAPNFRPMRRPTLNGLRQIDSIRDLLSFFSSVSILSYESVYKSGGSIDWEDVERGLIADMFEGR